MNKPIRSLEHSGYIVKLKECCCDHMQVVNAVCSFDATARVSCPVIQSSCFKGFALDACQEHVASFAKAHPDVDSIMPNYKVKACGQTLPWSMARIGALSNAALQIDGNSSTQSADLSSVHVFVLDTGVNVKHPDLDVVESLSFVTTEKGLTDLNGHGTASACTIAGKDNQSYTVGVCPGAKIHSCKVLGEDGSGSFYGIMLALNRVMDYHRDNYTHKIIVNMSLGGFVNTTTYTYVDEMIAYLSNEFNIPIIVAAGNDGDDAGLYSPAHVLEAITVGAYNSANQLSVFSNYGSCVDILAPGEQLVTPYTKFSQTLLSGTSFAAPITSGAVALHIINHFHSSIVDIKADLLAAAALATASNQNPLISHTRPQTTNQGLHIAVLS